MKTRFVSFGGGLVTGIFLFLLLSASMEKNESRSDNLPLAEAGAYFAPNTGYKEVPIKEFFNDVARYNRKHALIVAPTMPAEALNDSASRMFLYSVNVLEKFFADIKKHAVNANIKSEDLAIRFYYGVYPLGQKVARQNYSSLHTLFMVPNYWSEQEKRFRDFDIRKLAARITKDGGYGIYAKNREELINQYYLENMYQNDKKATAFMLDASAFEWTSPDAPQKASFFPALSPVLPPVINQGQLCPPNCPLNSLLDYIDSKPREFPGDWQ